MPRSSRVADPYSDGMNPRAWKRTCSQRYRPITSLPLPMPFGCCGDVELSRMRVVSTQLAPITTTLPSTCRSCPVFRSKYCTPLARPLSSTRTRATTALERISSLPVFSASGSRWSAEQKKDAVSHPRPHCPQWWHAGKPLCATVFTARRMRTNGIFSCWPARDSATSAQRIFGGGRKYLLPGSES